MILFSISTKLIFNRIHVNHVSCSNPFLYELRCVTSLSRLCLMKLRPIFSSSIPTLDPNLRCMGQKLFISHPSHILGYIKLLDCISSVTFSRQRFCLLLKPHQLPTEVSTSAPCWGTLREREWINFVRLQYFQSCSLGAYRDFGSGIHDCCSHRHCTMPYFEILYYSINAQHHISPKQPFHFGNSFTNVCAAFTVCYPSII